jgi:hypothetical protein
MVGRPEMLRMGDAESEHQAEVHVQAVIDRAIALEEMLRRRLAKFGNMATSIYLRRIRLNRTGSDAGVKTPILVPCSTG